MVRFTIRKDPDAPGYYFVKGGNIAGKYVKQIRVAGKIHAQSIADALIWIRWTGKNIRKSIKIIR